LIDLANELPGLKMQWYAWWMAHSVEAVALRHDIKPNHANWLEAFPFTTVSELPKKSKIPPVVPSDLMDAQTTRSIYGDGSFGGPYQVGEGVMEEIFNAALGDILDLLKFES
jgi:creatinine amidohydrolase